MRSRKEKQVKKKSREEGQRSTETKRLPEYLLQAPAPPPSLPPPVQTRLQELPFGQLPWDYFERLCKTLVEADHTIHSCRLYGRPGQKQRGIDLLAYPKEFQDERPTVYQCKRVETFGPAQIKGAVDKFLKGNWIPQPKQFVLCCRTSLRSTQCQNEILRQTVQLQKLDIVFEVWDGEGLSRKLKDHPKIVDDFFDRPYVKAFNGAEAAEALERRFTHTLAGSSVSEDHIARLLVSKDLQIQNLKSAFDEQLSTWCDTIKEQHKQGRRREAIQALYSHIDRFQTDLHEASPQVRARFWYTLGIFSWRFPEERTQAQQCFDNAQRIDPTFDLRPLKARLLLEKEQYEDSLLVLQPSDTPPTFTLSLAILLDLGRLTEFDSLWATATLDPDEVAYQLLSYRCRLDRRFDGAKDAIRKALERAPQVPDLFVTAGHVSFWEAVPEYLDESPRTGAPATFHPGIYTPIPPQILLLEEAATYYQRALDLLLPFTRDEQTQIREIQSFLLLCFAYHPDRQLRARELALDLLHDDPTDFAALFYCLEWQVPFEGEPSILALERKRQEGIANANDLAALANLYRQQNQRQKAIQLLEAEKGHFETEQAQALWTSLLLQLLVEEDPARAEAMLQANVSLDPLRRLRLQAQFYEHIGAYDQLESVAVRLYEEFGTFLDLLNLCSFYRKTEQWQKLEPYARDLVNRSPDPRSISFLALALYHNRKFEECLAQLDQHRSLFVDTQLPDHLRHVEIECLFKLNRLDRAAQQLQTLLRDQPSASAALNLIHAYVRMGKREDAVAVSRELSKAPWANTTLRLAGSQLLLRESPQEAYQLAAQAKELAPDDPAAWLHYIQTAFHTGHDREGSEALVSFQGRFPKSALLQSFQLNDFVEQYKKWQENQRQRWDLYRAGRVPFHLVMDAEKHPLGFDWFVRFRTNMQASQQRHKYPILIRYGGKPVDVNLQAIVNADSIILDYTGLLLASELNLLPHIEQAFRQILLPPSLLMLLEVEVQRTVEYQLSRVQVQQKIHDAIEGKKFDVLEQTVNPEILQRFQANNLAHDEAILFSLAEQQHALVLARHLLEEDERQYHLAEPFARLRVFPREAATALYQLGDLPQHSFNEATTAWRNEPCREEVLAELIEKKPLLLTDQLTAEVFADLDLLESLLRTFRVAVPASVVRSVRYTLQEYRHRQDAAQWLDSLRRYVRDRLGSHYFFPATSIDIDSDEADACARSLREGFHIAENEHIPVWIDDRWAHQYETVGQAPIVSTSTILALLKKKGQLTEEQYCESVFKLIERNALFLPFDSDMVFHFLQQASLQRTGQLQETYELKTLRRYAAGVFAQGTALNEIAPAADKLPEAVLYWQQHQEGCRQVLLHMWVSNDLTVEQKSAMSDWLIGKLWKGVEDVPPLLRSSFGASEAVAFSQHILVSTALHMALLDLHDNHGVNSAVSYLQWLYSQLLNPHWKANPEIQRLVSIEVSHFLSGMAEGDQGQFRLPVLAGTAAVLAKAPTALTSALLAEERMKALLHEYLRPIVSLSDEIKIPGEEWDRWAFTCLEHGVDVPVERDFGERSFVLQWHETSPFLSGLHIQWTTGEGKRQTQTRIEPFLALRHPLPSIRQQGLTTLLPLLHLSSEQEAKFSEQLRASTGWEVTVAAIEAEAQTSWTYFWQRLADLIRAEMEIDADFLFPNDPRFFTKRFPLPARAFERSEAFQEAWQALFQSEVEREGLGSAIHTMLFFPFGGEISCTAIISSFLQAKNVAWSEIQSTIEGIANQSTNPIILQNCLSLLLDFHSTEISHADTIRLLLQKLLTPQDCETPSKQPLSYDLYIALLQFAWCGMETQMPFQAVPVREKILWSYAYAGTFMTVVDDLWQKRGFDLDRSMLCRSLRAQSEPPAVRLFTDLYHEQLEVTHPLEASSLRTVISGTVRILAQHSPQDGWEEVSQRLITVARRIPQKQIEGAQEVFKRFSATKNFFGAPFDRNVLVSIAEIFGKLREDLLDAFEGDDKQLIQFVRTFVPEQELVTALQRIADQKVWQLNDLVLLGLSLDEPLESAFTELLQQALSHLDLSAWSDDREFTVACLMLARCVTASADPVLRTEVLDKLTAAWEQFARQPAQYNAILSAVILTLTDAQSSEPCTAFYQWWTDAIEKLRGQVPEELIESPIQLARQLPVKFQERLATVKSKLLMM